MGRSLDGVKSGRINNAGYGSFYKGFAFLERLYLHGAPDRHWDAERQTDRMTVTWRPSGTSGSLLVNTKTETKAKG
jgi:hypothetical protein